MIENSLYTRSGIQEISNSVRYLTKTRASYLMLGALGLLATKVHGYSKNRK